MLNGVVDEVHRRLLEQGGLDTCHDALWAVTIDDNAIYLRLRLTDINGRLHDRA